MYQFDEGPDVYIIFHLLGETSQTMVRPVFKDDT